MDLRIAAFGGGDKRWVQIDATGGVVLHLWYDVYFMQEAVYPSRAYVSGRKDMKTFDVV